MDKFITLFVVFMVACGGAPFVYDAEQQSDTPVFADAGPQQLPETQTSVPEASVLETSVPSAQEEASVPIEGPGKGSGDKDTYCQDDSGPPIATSVICGGTATVSPPQIGLVDYQGHCISEVLWSNNEVSPQCSCADTYNCACILSALPPGICGNISPNDLNGTNLPFTCSQENGIVVITCMDLSPAANNDN
jgi:hypothetical protein